MAREKMFDPAYQKVFTEAIQRENKIRMNWNHTYGTRGKRTTAVKWDEDPDDDGRPTVETLPGFRGTQPWPMPSRQERAWPTSTALPTSTIPRVTQPPVVMKPVPKDVQRILYRGLSHDGEGRAQYLRHRYRKSPEERFYFPVCSSWEYGWPYGGFQQCPKHDR